MADAKEMSEYRTRAGSLARIAYWHPDSRLISALLCFTFTHHLNLTTALAPLMENVFLQRSRKALYLKLTTIALGI